MPRHIMISDGPAQPDANAIDSFWSRACAAFPYPSPDIPIVLCDYECTPRLLVRLTEVREIVFDDIGPAETSLDGPPVQDPDIWVPLHRQCWNSLLKSYGRECPDGMPVMVEPFDYIGEIC